MCSRYTKMPWGMFWFEWDTSSAITAPTPAMMKYAKRRSWALEQSSPYTTNAVWAVFTVSVKANQFCIQTSTSLGVSSFPKYFLYGLSPVDPQMVSA